MDKGTLLDYVQENHDMGQHHVRLVSQFLWGSVVCHHSNLFTSLEKLLKELVIYTILVSSMVTSVQYVTEILYIGLSNSISRGLVQANVFVSVDQHVQLADFGLAGLGDTMTTAAATATNQATSLRWAAPELHNWEALGFPSFRRTRATDVYAFGGLCLEVNHHWI
jgi:serine/threonine protein kinase